MRRAGPSGSSSAAPQAPTGVPSLYYALPRSVVTVSIPVKKTSWEGPTCSGDDGKLAAEKIGINTEASGYGKAGQKIELGDPVIELRAEPDPQQLFAIELSKGFLSKTKHNFEFSERGLLTVNSLESENLAAAWGTKAFESVTKLVPSILGFGSSNPNAKGIITINKELCEAKATQIINLRQELRRLMNGSQQTNGTPRDALEFMVKELRTLESSEMEAFIGKQKVIESTVQCEYVPEPQLPENAPSKRPSVTPETVKLLGRGKAGLQGQPESKARCLLSQELAAPDEASEELITLKITPENDPFLTALNAVQPDEPKNAEGGLRYRIPGAAMLTVHAEGKSPTTGTAVNKLKAVTRRLIPQFGIVVTLPGDKGLGDVSKKLSTAFYGDLGMLKTLSMESASADPALLGAAADLGKTLLDEETKRRTTKEGKELADLEEKKKRLELEKAIRDFEAALAAPIQ
nr:DUF4831 family protein [Stigmatella aurantiaca]